MNAVLDVVLPVASRIVTTEAPIVNRAVASAVDLAARIRERGAPAEAEPDAEAAVRMALDGAGPDDLVCVTGSLYLVGAVRQHWITTNSVVVHATSLP
jgi:dihydrofolate synthase/folylpolyglutamate synthase